MSSSRAHLHYASGPCEEGHLCDVTICLPFRTSLLTTICLPFCEPIIVYRLFVTDCSSSNFALIFEKLLLQENFRKNDEFRNALFLLKDWESGRREFKIVFLFYAEQAAGRERRGRPNCQSYHLHFPFLTDYQTIRNSHFSSRIPTGNVQTAIKINNGTQEKPAANPKFISEK